MEYYVYILTNKNNKVLYVGVTSNLERRIFEHQKEVFEGFTKKYKIHKLVYYEQTNDVNSAIEREKALKKWNRAKKEMLINAQNPSWDDLGKTLND